MDVTATYRIRSTEKGLTAVREGKPAVFPPGPRRQLSVREQSLRTILEHRFGRIFQPELTPKNLVLSQDPSRPATELRLTQWQTANGWLVMAWRQVPQSTIANFNGTAQK
jgi:hypothetical protein